jgi:hypothetical protein
MSKAYEQAHTKYRDLAKRAANGDAGAKADKAKVMQEIRGIEREAARAGTTLKAVYTGDKVQISAETGRSKRSMQEEYVYKFDGEKAVQIGGKEQTLQEYHRDRLLRR